MNIIKATLTVFAFSVVSALHAQSIKDGETVDLNGVAVTFRVVNKEDVNVKGQTFDRYKVVAAVKNNTGKSFNIRLTSYPDLSGISASKLVELNCVNATGARLTSKKFDVSMTTHNLKVTYYTRNNDGKQVSTEMTIPAGYYLDQGQSVENDAIFIVPKGEALQVSVRRLVN